MFFDSYYHLFYDSPASSSQSVGGWVVWHRQAGMGGSRVGFYFKKYLLLLSLLLLVYMFLCIHL